jgi:predicted RNA methylase
VDRDPEACDLAAQLIERFHLAGRIGIVQGNAEDYSFDQDDRVICASLLSAPGIFGTLLARRVSTVVLRNAVGLFRFCYRQAPEPSSAYHMARETFASPRTINVSRLYHLSRT